MTELLIGVGIILIIVCLVVRDRTEYRLTRMRSGFLALRNTEQRLAQKHREMESLAQHADEAFVRATQRQQSSTQGNREFIDLLKKLYPLIKGTPLEISDNAITPAPSLKPKAD
jgi:hypothetical protein